MRWAAWILLVGASGCALDFDALERGRDGGALDAGARLDGSGPDVGRQDGQLPHDAHSIDADAIDARPTDAQAIDAVALVDSAGLDAGEQDASTADASVDAPQPDAFTGPDAADPCPRLDCSDLACAGRPCDDGLACTEGDHCSGRMCRGFPVMCNQTECTVSMCVEPMGCRAVGVVADATPCSGGRCCSGMCSNLVSSANCGGCGLSCDEEGCGVDVAPTCACVTNAGCPRGQVCEPSGRCACRDSSGCAAGQTCVGGRCAY